MSGSPSTKNVTVTTKGFTHCTCGAWMREETSETNWAAWPHCTNCHAVRDGYDPEVLKHYPGHPAWGQWPAKEPYDYPETGVSGHLACAVCGECGPAQQPEAYGADPGPAAIYCSSKCRQKAYRARRKADPDRYGHEDGTVTVTQWPKMTCLVCKGSIVGEAWYGNWGAVCSWPCLADLVKTREIAFRDYDDDAARPCVQCGRVMHGVNAGRQYCTAVCRKRAARTRPSVAQRRAWDEDQPERDAQVWVRLKKLDVALAEAGTDRKAASVARREAQRDIKLITTPPWDLVNEDTV